jgi:hypothetical protein
MVTIILTIYITILYNLKSITSKNDSGTPKQRNGHATHQIYKATYIKNTTNTSGSRKLGQQSGSTPQVNIIHKRLTFSTKSLIL